MPGKHLVLHPRCSSVPVRRQPVRDRALWEPLLLLADHFREPRIREDASAYLHSPGVDAASTEAAMPLLEHGNCLIPAHPCELSGADAELASLDARVNGLHQAPSHGPVNMPASSLAALDVLRHLGGFDTPASLNRRVGVWSHDLTLDRQAAERAPACPTRSAACCCGRPPIPASPRGTAPPGTALT